MAEAPYAAMKRQLLDAILDHVAFDGWSEVSFKAAIRDAAVDERIARSVCPRGAVDLAVAFHERGDALMRDTMKSAALSEMKIREKVTFGVRARIEAIADKEAVRRGTTLFALPHLAGDGAKLIWGTADAIWEALGDPSDDINWYTKRATLSGVYGATVLFWLGDSSLENEATWAFLDRRIENVMQFEKVKAQVTGNEKLKPLMAGPNWLVSFIKAPTRFKPSDLPGGFGGQ